MATATRRLADLLMRERAGLLARAEVAEAAAGQMRVLAEAAYARLSETGDPQAAALGAELDATDAGRGWVSPEAHAAVVLKFEQVHKALARLGGRSTYHPHDRDDLKLYLLCCGGVSPTHSYICDVGRAIAVKLD